MSRNVVDFPRRPGRASLRLTEDSLAQTFVDEHGERLRFDHETNRWYVFDGVGWRHDRTGDVVQLARHLMRSYVARGGISAKLEEKLGQKKTITSVESLARSDERVAITGERLDRCPWVIGTPGGVYSLKRQARLPHKKSRKLLVTKRMAVTPAAPGTVPHRWIAFLEEAMGGDAELVDFLQRLAGYCLTGCVHEQLLFFFWGPGGNGKGVFLRTLAKVLGEYARTAPMSMFIETDAYRHETELANLRGARLVTAEESGKGKGLDEAKIKHLTGEDRISARLMRSDFFEFDPTFKLILASNHKPELRGVDKALRRRVRLVPWTVDPAKVDRGLERQLARELPAIARWCLDGTAAWREGGLTMPAAVLAATEDYFSGQDSIGQWLEEACTVDAPPINLSTKRWSMAGTLFASWKAFCESRNERPGRMNMLAEELKKRGFLSDRQKAGVRYFGLALKSQVLDNAQSSDPGLV